LFDFGLIVEALSAHLYYEWWFCCWWSCCW